jgi:hypothetical protein
MILCGSRTEVKWVSTGETTHVYCRLSDDHTGDHEGRVDYAGLLFTWPRDPTPLVIRIDGPAPPADCPPNPLNAACVIKAAPAPLWPPPYPEQQLGPKVRIE